MKPLNVAIVQASSRSWSGGSDVCMNLMDGRPIVAHTVERLKPFCKRIVVAAPEFDRGGLDFLAENDDFVQLYYGQDESPLLRMVAAMSGLDDEEYVLRVNALNFCVDMDSAVAMLSMAEQEGVDVVRFPENFPALFASDIYGLSALRRLAGMNPEPMFHVHPKYAMTESNGFRSLVGEPPLDRYSDEMLWSVRKISASSIIEPRTKVDRSRAISAGDSLAHHYEMVMAWLKPTDKVLDMACGSGFGAAIMAEKAARVTGIDLDESQLGDFGANVNHDTVELLSGDCLNTGFAPACYDCVTAFEIIEHVDAHGLLKEIFRVLKPGGFCFISSPQNVLGHIPVTPYHVIEYSLSGLLELVSGYFEVEKVIGIKQGTILFESDPVGSNTFVVCRKPVSG